MNNHDFYFRMSFQSRVSAVAALPTVSGYRYKGAMSRLMNIHYQKSGEGQIFPLRYISDEKPLLFERKN